MPITPTYPGVYVEEIPSGVRTIVGVSTSVAAFIGYFKKGQMNKPLQIFNMGDFERELGGLDSKSEASYAIQQFFLNGGKEAWVVRTASGSFGKSSVEILDGIDGSPALYVEAVNEGAWGEFLRARIDYDTSDPDSQFNLTILEYASNGTTMRVSRSELFRNLSIINTNTRFVDEVVNDEMSGSKLVRVKASGTTRPLQNGTVSGDLSVLNPLTVDEPNVNVAIGAEGPITAEFKEKPTTLAEARKELEAAIRACKPESKAFSEATVDVSNNRLVIFPGSTVAELRVVFSPFVTDETVRELKLDLASARSFKGIMSGDITSFSGLSSSERKVDLKIGGSSAHTVILTADPTTPEEARNLLEEAIHTIDGGDAFGKACVCLYSDNGNKKIVVVPGTPNVEVTFSQNEDDDTTISELKLDSNNAIPISGLISGNLDPFSQPSADPVTLKIKIGGGEFKELIFPKPNNFTTTRSSLETAITGLDGDLYQNARVAGYNNNGEKYLIVFVESVGETVTFTYTPSDSTTVAELKLDRSNGATSNVREYTLAGLNPINNTAQGIGTVGNDGSPPDGLALIGDLNSKKGIYALEDVDIFNILCIPRTAMVSKDEARAVMVAAINYCEKRRAFFIVDTPRSVDEVQEIKMWLNETSSIRHRNAALYFPRIKAPDPLNEFRLRSYGASGTIAGLFSRIDVSRGVWKAPAGTEATLANVQALDCTLTDAENGTLNPLGINCLRTFAVHGNICWGARTLEGADQMTSEWKYIPVRRLALFIEETLYRNTKWVVFEPNDEPLWAQIRLNIGAFMHRLFRQGAFQGTKPKDAYFVKCDSETTTPADVDLGIVNIVVGFAPLKPAEFVIIKIQQIAGKLET